MKKIESIEALEKLEGLKIERESKIIILEYLNNGIKLYYDGDRSILKEDGKCITRILKTVKIYRNNNGFGGIRDYFSLAECKIKDGWTVSCDDYILPDGIVVGCTNSGEFNFYTQKESSYLELISKENTPCLILAHSNIDRNGNKINAKYLHLERA